MEGPESGTRLEERLLARNTLPYEVHRDWGFRRAERNSPGVVLPIQEEAMGTGVCAHTGSPGKGKS